jgi:hypothetical protein
VRLIFIDRQRKTMKACALILLVFAWCNPVQAVDGMAIRTELEKEADFIVSVVGVHTDKFELGLMIHDETSSLRRVRFPREGYVWFFRDQKYKNMILVRYYATTIEDWDTEIAKTVRFFNTAGYTRIVLLEEYGLTPGFTVVHDSFGRFTKRQFIPFEEEKNEPNKAVKPTPVNVTVPASAGPAPFTSAAHLDR